jgi:circadian clock protein KaiB
MDKFVLKLYITGRTPSSERAVANLKRICREELHDQYEMVIIDVLERPQLAEDERILATPTLIKTLPPPLRRIIGDLSNTEKVLLGLDLRHFDQSKQPEGDQ